MKISDFKSKIAEFFGDRDEAVQKRAGLIFFCGIVGIVLIFFSQINQGENSSVKANKATDNMEAESRLEQRLTEIVSSINGAGTTKIMLTLESSAENIYAKEEKSTEDKSREKHNEISESVQEKHNTETKHIIIDSGGNKEALIEKQIEPVVKGVVVLCEGADNPIIEARVTQAVSTALGVPTSRICVIKISK